MSKPEMRSEGIPSPDLWDAICQFFLEDAIYTISEQAHGPVNSEEDQWKKLMDAMNDSSA
jgi:hypothetical protein